MKNYKITISYDGTRYCGWQKQPNGLSIQCVIEDKLQILTRHPAFIVGSGRTDAGVHAYGQVAHFQSEIELDCYSMLKSINSILPSDIRIIKFESADPNFHARYSAKSKVYQYNLWLDKVMSPFKKDYCHHVHYNLDIDAMQQAITLILGKHNFASFANQAYAGSAAKNPIRDLRRIDIIEQEGGVRLEFEANGFLYKMVRNITGTLLEVGYHKRYIENITELLQIPDRRSAGEAAPAKGLFLFKVNY